MSSDGQKFMSFIGCQCMFASCLVLFTSKSMSRFIDFGGRENQSLNEDLDLKWKEFDRIYTEKLAFPGIPTQAERLTTLLH